ncbi:MAG: hypothetical protein VXX82_03260 [Verrucomicrobiota bacterium]|nr:hypothetical protein [Verrucomicrobiota bacterium]
MVPPNKTENIVSHEKEILLGFAITKKNLDGSIQVSLRWGRLLICLLLMFCISWLGVTGGLYLWFKYNKDFDTVRFTGMITLPFRIDEHRREMGDYHVKKGLELLDDKKYSDALRLLRLGVARSPGNLEGIQVLAVFYEKWIKRPDIAANILIKGLTAGNGLDDPDYLKATLLSLHRNQMDTAIQSIAEQHLPTEVEITRRNQILAFSSAKSNTLRGNFDRADELIRSYELLDELDGLLLSAEISWARGNKLSAISKLEVSVEKFSNAEPLLMALSKYNREIDRYDEARRYAIFRNASAPLSVAPRIELLYIYKNSGDLDREEKETQRMLKQFRGDSKALLALANYSADTGNINLARRTYEEALENEFNIDAFALLLVEAHLVATDFQGALNFAEELLNERPNWLEKHWGIFCSLRSVASFGNNRPDLGEIYLQEFLSSSINNTNPEQSLAIANRFRIIDCPQQARTVLLAAHKESINNQKVLSELISVELEIGNTENLNTLLKQLLTMRRPEAKLIAEAYKKLGSDRFIFTPNRENLLLELNAELRERAL